VGIQFVVVFGIMSQAYYVLYGLLPVPNSEVDEPFGDTVKIALIIDHLLHLIPSSVRGIMKVASPKYTA